MPCYHPLKGYRAPFPNSNGKFGFVFDRTGASIIPCGKCVGCLLDRSKMWAVRCMHEASLYERNCLITLTYSEDNLPPFGALEKRALQLFFKRLRKRYGAGIRYYACGEYGSDFGRPHFHACVFNHDFADKLLWSVRNGHRLYTSASLADLWPFGFSSVGDVTFASAAYVARYVMKKVFGSGAQPHYTRLVPETGELVSIPPEFTVMSRRPGLAKFWFDKFSSDVYPDNFVLVNGAKCKPPRFYDQQLEKLDISAYELLKEARYESSVASRWNQTPERLKVRETITRSRLSQLKRSL